ncbi:MAG: ABC transporter ATP-binding protein [Pseudomonadota bacterium]
MALFSARNITKAYGTGDTTLTVLKGISLSIEPGEMTGVIGASGSGKTTLLQILGTLDLPTAGEIFYRDQPLLAKSARDLAKFRNGAIGFIFQFHHLLPDFTALENVMIPGLIAGKSRQEMIGPAGDLLEQVELGHRTNHKVLELSGGEQQRAALARALIMQPDLLFADEPTGNLDSRAGNLVFELLHGLCRERKLSTIMVTHNTMLAERMDHCLTLRDGVLENNR